MPLKKPTPELIKGYNKKFENNERYFLDEH